MAGGGLQKRAKAGQAKIARPEHEHFASHQKEPATGHGHHGIPNETNGGKRQIEFDETLPTAEAINGGGFFQFTRLRFQ